MQEYNYLPSNILTVLSILFLLWIKIYKINKQIIVDGLSGAMAAFISAVVFFPFDNFITRCQNFESKKKEKKQEEKDNYKGDNSIALIHA